METNNTLQEQAKKLRKMRRRQRIASLLGIAVLVWGVVQAAILFLDYKSTETSNDAQVEQYISPVNLRASGYIQKICFTEHQNVRKGDTLLVLDDREYRIRVMEAEAALKDALAGATVMDATLQTTQNNASVFEASIAEIEIRLAKLEKDRQRYANLLKRNAATPIQLEQIETEYEATRKKLEAVKRQQKAARSGVNEVSHRRQNIEASIQRAQAALERVVEFRARGSREKIALFGQPLQQFVCAFALYIRFVQQHELLFRIVGHIDLARLFLHYNIAKTGLSTSAAPRRRAAEDADAKSYGH